MTQPEDIQEKYNQFSRCLESCRERLNKLRSEYTIIFESKILSAKDQADNSHKMFDLHEKIEYEQELYDVIHNALQSIRTVNPNIQTTHLVITPVLVQQEGS